MTAAQMIDKLPTNKQSQHFVHECSGQAAEWTAVCQGEVDEGFRGLWLWTNGSPVATAKGHMV